VQYTKNDWRNRNIIKTPNGTKWLTIPLRPSLGTAIDEVVIGDDSWVERHIRSLELSYRRAAAYAQVSAWLFENLRLAAKIRALSACNEHLLRVFCERLHIRTAFYRSTEVLSRNTLVSLGKTERLIRLCREVGADCYLSGPAAKAYIDLTAFEQNKIGLRWMSYEGYRDYPQCWGPFAPRVSIVDLLLNCGDEAAQYLEH